MCGGSQFVLDEWIERDENEEFKYAHTMAKEDDLHLYKYIFLHENIST